MYRKSLSTPLEGTLSKKGRFNENDYHDRIYAKTGYVSGAWALSGYCRAREGRWLCFSVLAQGKKRPVPIIDQIVKELME